VKEGGGVTNGNQDLYISPHQTTRRYCLKSMYALETTLKRLKRPLNLSLALFQLIR